MKAGRWFTEAGQDFRFGLRQLRRNPGFALTAIASLALGIGANTAIFTLFDQILLRLLPVERPQELVQLRMEGGRFGSQSGDGLHTFSHPLYVALRDRNQTLAGLTGQRVERTSLVGEDSSEMISAGLVAGNFFQVLGVRPARGRMLTPEDDQTANSHAVAVLQHDFWLDRYAGREDILGSTIRLNGHPFTVVGVASPGFEGTDIGLPTQVWIPVMMKLAITPSWDSLADERDSWFYLFGRLKPGVTREAAEAELKVLYQQRQQEELTGPFFQKFPEVKERFLRQSPELIPASGGFSTLRRIGEQPLKVLQWLVGLVLLIACTNVANLMLARAAARQKEVAVRAALGAGRGRIVRQLLAESLALAVAGGAGGVMISIWATRGLVSFLPFDPGNLTLSTMPDARVLLFAAGVTMLTAVVFGLAPALQASRIAPASTLKDEAGTLAGGRAHVLLRKSFVGLQVALSCLLLIGAGLFVRTLRNLNEVDLGFRTENVAMFGLRPATVYDDARKLQVYRDVVQSLAAVPGVRSVGANTTRLLTGGRWDSSITLPGAVSVEDGEPWSFFNAITPGYFETLGLTVVRGRDLQWSDWGRERQMALVNETLVKEYLGGADPVGRFMAQGAKKEPDTEIIGVFSDARYHDVRGETPRQTFVSMGSRMQFVSGVNVYVRITGDPRAVLPLLRDQVRRVDANLVVSDLRMMDEQLERRLSTERLLGFLSAGFAFLASLLALVGLHGVLSFVVLRRSREIGIRMALGAGQGRVVRLVLQEIVFVVCAGVAAGAIAAAAGGRWIESQLFGVRAADPAVFVVCIALLTAAALAAAFVPAWRASRIHPMHALRQD
ncbi:MAG: ABC transporter permease [Bryobacteraceae bacterium]|nr:ABC transporter permease [Bryobacteraceae bacterium]